jgi:hypothetical protein
MAKKLILLILALPLVLMIVLFALTRTVGSAIDAPVTGIQIVGEHTAYISLDTEETYTIEYAILPTTAKNRDIVVQTAAVGTLPEATFVIDYSEEGRVLLTPTASGASRVTLKTVDGNFSDSVTIFVDSTLLTAISPSITKEVITVGEKLPITTVFTPETAENIALSYTSSNPKVLTVDENGIVRGVSSGVATVTVRSLVDSNIFATLTITVRNTDTMDVEETVSTTKPNGKITISMDTDSTFDASHFSCLVYKTDGTVANSKSNSQRKRNILGRITFDCRPNEEKCNCNKNGQNKADTSHGGSSLFGFVPAGSNIKNGLPCLTRTQNRNQNPLCDCRKGKNTKCDKHEDDGKVFHLTILSFSSFM